MSGPIALPEDVQPGDLVESFSWEIAARQRTDDDTEEYEQLRKDFLEERERRRRKRKAAISSIEAHFRETRSDDGVIFQKAKAQLLAAQQRFADLVPDSNLAKSDTWGWDDISSVANQAMMSWEAKRTGTKLGRARDRVRKMCDTMNNHSNALKMLPSESHYVSLISGSVTMVIKAAANHIEISESFAQGIVTINDAVRLEGLSHVYDSPSLQQLTMRLYAQIFSYLIKFMTWFTDRSRKRLLNSFRENALKLFQDELTQVMEVSGFLSRQIQMHMSADVRITRKLLEHQDSDLEYLVRMAEAGERNARLRDAANVEAIQRSVRLEIERSFQKATQEHFQGIMAGYHEKLRASISGRGTDNLLSVQAGDNAARSRPIKRISQASDTHEDDDEGSFPTLRLSQGTHRTVNREEDGDISAPSNSDDDEMNSASSDSDVQEVPSEETHPHSADLAYQSRHLEDYFSWDSVGPLVDHSMPLIADTAFVSRLETFTTTKTSQVLYAQTPYRGDSITPLKSSASAFVSLVSEARMPVLSYFCQLSPETPPKGRSRETIELCAMIPAIIRQIIILLPPGAPDLEDQTMLSSLDGTLRTWKQALCVLEHVIKLVQLPLLFLVIDDLHVLENDSDGSTEMVLFEFVSLILKLVEPGALGEGRAFKVLFTTSGVSDTLSRLLHEDDIEYCNSAPGGLSRARSGRQVFHF